MFDTYHPKLAIIVSHVVIFIVQLIIKSFIPLGREGSFGIYLMLLAIGFNCFGAEFPPEMIAGSVLLGLALLVWDFRKTATASRTTQEAG